MYVRFSLSAILLMGLVLSGCARRSPSPDAQAKSLFGEGDWAGAVAACTSILVERPDDVEMLTLRGQSYLALKQYDRATADFSCVIEVLPEDSEGYYLRQLAYQRAGQNELAEADGNAARALDPRYQTAYIFESRNFNRSGTPRKAAAKRAAASDADERDDPTDQARTTAESESPAPLSDSPAPWLTADVETPSPHSSKVPGGERPAADQQIASGTAQPTAGSGISLEHGQASDNREVAAGGVVAQPPPRPPEGPGEPQAPQTKPEAGDEPEDKDVHQKWLADQRRQGTKPDEIVVPDDDSPDAGPAVPGLPRPTLSTSLPPAGVAKPGMTAAPGFVAPRTTGISSRRPLSNLSPATPTAVPATRLRPEVPERGDGLASPTRFLPGEFQGNTLYTPGKPQPPLSTSLPGGGIRGNRSKSAQQPVLSTQLPPERTVRPAAGRPTGIKSKKNRPSSR